MKSERFVAGLAGAVLAVAGLSWKGESSAKGSGHGDDVHHAVEAAVTQAATNPVKPPGIRTAGDAIRAACQARGRDSDCGGPPLLLIATVPDPERSGIPALFDSAVESIQRAAAFSKFNLFQANVLTLEPGGIGSMVFRQGLDRVLIVLLVGEAPMSGIDLAAFRTAVEIHDALHPGAEIKILGPTFSGSSAPIAAELNRERGRKALVVSGTATSPNNVKTFGDLSKRLRYFSAVENDQVTLCAFLKFLSDRGIPQELVGLLAEAGTVFSRDIVDTANVHDSSSCQPGLTAEFPMQISRLRAAYQNNPNLRALWKAGSDPSTGPRLTGDPRVAKSERPQAAAPDQTAMELELGVAELSTAINRLRIRVAIIAASDEADILFLAKLLQRLSPNVRLATLDADLLYLHSTPDLSFAGLMMVTPYPLWYPNQAGGRSHRLQPFTSRAAQGVFNAALILLEDNKKDRHLAEFFHPLGTRNFPPAWITIVGGGDIWPLAILDPPPGAGSSLRDTAMLVANPAVHTPEIPRSGGFLFLFGLAAILSLWTMANYLLFALGKPPVFTPFDLPRGGAGPRKTTLYGILIASGLVLYAQYMVVILGPHAQLPARGFLEVTALLVPMLCIPLGFVERDRNLMLLTGGLAVAAVTGFRWYFGSVAGDPEVALPFAARSLVPFSGVDPLTPQTFVWFALVWWAAATLHRMRLGQVRDPGNPLGDSSGHGISRAIDNLRVWLNCPQALQQLPLVGLTLFIFCSAIGWRWRAGLEPAPWQIVFTVGFLTLWAFCAGSAIRLVRIALNLGKVLRPLPWLRIGEAFGRLDKDIALSDMWSRGSRQIPFEDAGYSVQLLERIVPELDRRDFDQRLKSLQNALTRCCEASQASLPVPPSQAAEVQVLLRAFAQDFATELGYLRSSVHQPPAVAMAERKEEYLALRIVSVAWYAILHMRLILEFLTIGALALFLSVLSYPFQPQSALADGVLMMALVCGGATLFVFHQLDTDEILHKLRPEGKSSWTESFHVKAIGYGILPLLAALANRFPGTLRRLTDLIDPLTKLAGS